MAATMVTSENANRILGAIVQLHNDPRTNHSSSSSSSVRKTRTYNVFEVDDWMKQAAAGSNDTTDELSHSRRRRARSKTRLLDNSSGGSDDLSSSKQGRRRTGSKTRLLDSSSDGGDRRRTRSKTRLLEDSTESSRLSSRSKSSSKRLGRRVEGMKRSGSGGAISMLSALEISSSYKNATDGSKKYTTKEDELKERLKRTLGRQSSARELKSKDSSSPSSNGMRRIKSSEDMPTPEKRERRSKKKPMGLPPKSKSGSSSKSSSRKNSEASLQELRKIAVESALEKHRRESDDRPHRGGGSTSITNTPDKRRSNRRRLNKNSKSLSMPKIQVDASDEEVAGLSWWGDIVADAKGQPLVEKKERPKPSTRPKLDTATIEPKPRPKVSRKDSAGRRGRYSKSASQPNLMMNLRDEEIEDGPEMRWQDRAPAKRSYKAKGMERRSSLNHEGEASAGKQLRNNSNSPDGRPKGREDRRSCLPQQAPEEPKTSPQDIGGFKARASRRSQEEQQQSTENERFLKSRASRQNNMLLDNLRSSRHGKEDDLRSSRHGREDAAEMTGQRDSRSRRQNMLVDNLRSSRHGKEDEKRSPADEIMGGHKDSPSSSKQSSLSSRLSSSSLQQQQSNSPKSESLQQRLRPESTLEKPTQNSTFYPPHLQQQTAKDRTTFGRPTLGRPTYSERKLSGLERSDNNNLGMRRPKSSAGLLNLKNNHYESTDNTLRRPASSGGLLDLMDDDEEDYLSVSTRSKQGATINFGSGGIVMPAIQAGPNANAIFGGKEKEKKSISKSMLSALSFGIRGKIEKDQESQSTTSSTSRAVDLARRENTLTSRNLQNKMKLNVGVCESSDLDSLEFTEGAH